MSFTLVLRRRSCPAEREARYHSGGLARRSATGHGGEILARFLVAVDSVHGSQWITFMTPWLWKGRDLIFLNKIGSRPNTLYDALMGPLLILPKMTEELSRRARNHLHEKVTLIST